MPLTRRTVVQVKTEATYATDPTPATTDAIFVDDLSLSLNSEPQGRAMFSPSFDARRRAVIGKRSWSLSFTTTLNGNTNAAAADKVPMYDAMLKACGLGAAFGAGTWTYTPAASALSSCTFWIYQDGVRYKITGCRGNVRFVLTAGEVARAEWEFQGLYTETPTATAVSTPDYADLPDAPLVVNTGWNPIQVPGGDFDTPTVSEFGHIRSATIDLRNALGTSESLTVGDGVRSHEIVGRGDTSDPGIALTFEIEQPTAHDGITAASIWSTWADRADSGLLVSSTLALVGNKSGQLNKHTFTMQTISVDEVQPIDLDGRVGYTVDARILADTALAGGDDALLLAATDVP